MSDSMKLSCPIIQNVVRDQALGLDGDTQRKKRLVSKVGTYNDDVVHCLQVDWYCHVVNEKHGGDAPPGTVFKGRVAVAPDPSSLGKDEDGEPFDEPLLYKFGRSIVG